MSDIRQKIVQALIKTKLGLTTREIADELSVKPTVISGHLTQMSTAELVAKGEYLEGEGQVWTITEKGSAEFGSKNETVETPVPKSVVKKSVKDLVIDDEAPATVVKKSAKSVALNPGYTFKPDYMKPMKITPEIGTFEIHQIMEHAAVELAKLFEQKPKRVVLNLENKVKTLMTLSELGNNSIAVILNDIISDLQAA